MTEIDPGDREVDYIVFSQKDSQRDSQVTLERIFRKQQGLCRSQDFKRS